MVRLPIEWGDKTAPSPASYGHEEMMNRIAAKAARDRADWAALLMVSPDILDHRITRPMVEAALRAAGYRKRGILGETLFEKSLDAVTYGIFPNLKTMSGSDIYAPSQRLTFLGTLADHRAAKVTAVLLPSLDPMSPTTSVDEVRREGFVLTQDDIGSALVQVEAALADVDIEAVLKFERQISPLQPGGAGLNHIVALVLDGDVETLGHYDLQRKSGETAGFYPFITDKMVADALVLAGVARGEGPAGLDRYLQALAPKRKAK